MQDVLLAALFLFSWECQVCLGSSRCVVLSPARGAVMTSRGTSGASSGARGQQLEYMVGGLLAFRALPSGG